MNTVLYLVSMLAVAATLLGIPATFTFLAHARTEHDHGPGCWWCHPHFTYRRNAR